MTRYNVIGLVIASLFAISCSTTPVDAAGSPDASAAQEPLVDNGPALKDVYAPCFLMGAAINGYNTQTAAINHPGMADILKRHFNTTTLSNLMKPSYLLDEKASKAAADGLPVTKFDSVIPSMNFCRDNGIVMRGHTLVWHNQTPDWFFYEDYDKTKPLADAATMDKRLESYIKQVIEFLQGEYPGVIYCWDVVNEVINDNGTWRHDKSFWHQIMGTSYIEKAFTYARTYAEPSVRLIYNDYNVFLPPKRDAIYKMVEGLKEKGIIDGIGLQPTVGLTWPQLDGNASSSFRTMLATFAKLGLELQVTELGFHVPEKQRGPASTVQQTARFREMMELLLEFDSDNGGPANITSVTVFGICDDYPLYNNHRQDIFLYDGDCNPKPALFAWREPGLALQAAKEGE